MKTSELEGPALDWAVAQCEGKVHGWQHHLLDIEDLDLVNGLGHSMVQRYKPSANWAQAGPIIEGEEIGFAKYGPNGTWKAVIGETPRGVPHYGPTPLIAVMRCYVSSKLGDEVEIPEELI